MAKTLLVYFEKGGPLMWPLLACSVISLALILARGLTFAKIARGKKRFLQGLRERAAQGDLASVRNYCLKSNHPLAGALNLAFEKAAAEHRDPLAALEEIFVEFFKSLTRQTQSLSFLAQIATLLGFTGTVTGMIKAFEAIVAKGTTTPSIVAGGIGEALITTAYGLFIAVPCVVFQGLFSLQYNSLSREMDHLLDQLERRKTSPSSRRIVPEETPERETVS